MKRLFLTEHRCDVAPLHQALLDHPELWDQYTSRTADPRSPHHGLSDIWARYAPLEIAHLPGQHESVWYPVADILPVRQLVEPLFEAVGGKRLGGVLITKIPAGAECKPHADHGWHARFYEKFAVQVASSPGQAFRFDGESLETKPGDVFWFDNAYTHWVTNPTPFDRITLIACIRRQED